MRPAEELATDEPRRLELLPAERRLAESRAEIEELLIPQPDSFPRSQTMRFLMGRNGKTIAIGAFAALFAVNPRLAMSFARLMPIGRFVQRFF